jgi:predicted RNase H-like nuclease (RuvC/YqgF family)
MLGKDQRIEKQRAQIAALRASSGESQRIVGDLDGEVASLRQQIAVESEGRERAVARRDAEIARLEGQAAAVSSTVAGKDAEIARLKERAAAVSREFAACVQQQRSYKALARCCVDVNPLDIVQDDPANRAALARDPNLLHAFVMDAGNQGIWETHRAAVEAASRNNIKREAVVKREAVAEREVKREAVAEEDIDEYL